MPMACLALALVAVSNIASARERADRGREPWAHWEAFREHFISEDGRVIDHTSDARSTSEGQAYGLFFALVADDRELFDLLLSWTENNLAAGDLKSNLPGWLWGQDEDGTWHLLDANSAADADVWMIYALLEAGRLWGEPRYYELAGVMAARVVETEVVELPDLGPMLLPGPSGFVLAEGTWRFNPSYMPLQVLRRLQQAYPDGPWEGIAETTVVLLSASSAHGCAPDWIGYQDGAGFVADPVTGAVGSYDAIRTYLWAAMLHDEEPAKGVLGHRLSALGQHWRAQRTLPPSVKPFEGTFSSDKASVGFFGALLPEVDTWSDAELSALIRQHIQFERNGDLYGGSPDYYDHNLLLFGLGYAEHRFRFERDGRLTVPWGIR